MVRPKKERVLSNCEIAKILSDIAAAYEVKGENRFKITAYQRASASVEHATSELKDLWDDHKLDQIPGVGENISSHLDELFRTGKVKHFIKVKKGLPASMFKFLDIPGVGSKTAYSLAKNLNILKEENCLERLEEAAKNGKIRKIENFGEKSEQEILKGLKTLKKGEGKTKRMLLPYADILASEIISYLKQSSFVIDAHPLGSLRRMSATIGDIDISICTKSPDKVIEYIVKYKKIRDVLEKGSLLLRLILYSGQQADFRFSSPENYGAMLQYFTGSKQHNIELREFALKKGMSLSEYGIKKNQKSKIKDQNQNVKLKTFKDENSFYKELGLDCIPPELREAQGEIEAAKLGKLPKLVESNDIKGDLHVHSNFPIEPSHDLGESSPEEMIKEAKDLGYEYIGFSEHNPSISKHTKQKCLDLLKKKRNLLEQLNYSEVKPVNKRVNKLSIRIMNGLEIDVKPNGDLAVPEEAFELIDYAIVSIHSEFNLNKDKMTKRVLEGLSHPKVKILGHPTGRLLGEREGFELDWEKVFDFCLKNKKILEISAWPNRLDLPDTLVKEAVKLGIMLVVNSDSHHVEQMKLMKYGVSVARRGWAESKNIINTFSFEEIKPILL